MAEQKPFYMLGQPGDPMLPKSENALVRSISREADLAWLAGIMDGEGCLSLNMKVAHNGKRYLQPKIRVFNTDVRMIQKIARIYCAENVVFFYALGRRIKPHYKDQLAIIVSSQGSCRKVLKMVLPYLANKKHTAEAMLYVLSHVQSLPKGGNTVAHDYESDGVFVDLLSKYEEAKNLHIEPSTTTRRAGSVCDWQHCS
jgi:hypothetical protein